MKQYLLWATLFGLLLLIDGCENDPSPIVCRPTSLQIAGDSIVFTYNGAGRIGVVSYYNILLRKIKEDELTYNASGNLATLTKTVYPIASDEYVAVTYSLTYDNMGRPTELVSQPPLSDPLTTEFTHDDQGRLSEAITTSATKFIGSTRYEYDEMGNIPKVFYTLNLNHQVQEVLARENFTFDENEKFYFNVPELKICNEYLYAYLPTKNNCLSSTVYYLSYDQRFVSPQAVNFQALYNDQGMIERLETESTIQFYSGDALFDRVLYTCK